MTATGEPTPIKGKNYKRQRERGSVTTTFPVPSRFHKLIPDRRAETGKGNSKVSQSLLRVTPAVECCQASYCVQLLQAVRTFSGAQFSARVVASGGQSILTRVRIGQRKQERRQARAARHTALFPIPPLTEVVCGLRQVGCDTFSVCLQPTHAVPGCLLSCATSTAHVSTSSFPAQLL